MMISVTTHDWHSNISQNAEPLEILISESLDRRHGRMDVANDHRADSRGTICGWTVGAGFDYTDQFAELDDQSAVPVDTIYCVAAVHL
ncbi:MAG TPA: hypothetical protein VMG35_11105 [Bryobacteraceae bacterium]|nr:hypothetical protein [Bryobacteraceae bacterium]